MAKKSILKPETKLKVNRTTFLASGILFFLFGVTLYIYGGGPLELHFLNWSKTAPLWLSDILHNCIQYPLLGLVAIISLSCLIGVFAPKTINKFLDFLDEHRRLKKYAAGIYFGLYSLAFVLNFFTSWILNLVSIAQQQYLFFVLYGAGLIWTIAIVRASFRDKGDRVNKK